MRIEKALHKFNGQPLTQQILMDLLKEYQWPHNKVRNLVDRNVLIPVKRGLYITGPEMDMLRPSLNLLANHIYGPSYVSMETALSWWGMIPEKVTAISSMTTGKTKIFRTKLGRFMYVHAKLPYYSYGIQQVTLAENQSALMASKEKALCDKIVTTKGTLLRSIQQTMDWLIEDMRMEKQMLKQLDTRAINSWLGHAPKKQSLSLLVKTLDSL